MKARTARRLLLAAVPVRRCAHWCRPAAAMTTHHRRRRRHQRPHRVLPMRVRRQRSCQPIWRAPSRGWRHSRRAL